MIHSIIKVTIGMAAILLAGCTSPKTYQWGVHDMSRPQPRVVTPGAKNHLPPSDAIVLFDGSDLSAWQHKDGSAAKWKVENGVMTVAPKTGDIQTQQAFGSCQLHIEWASPALVPGKGQKLGNSGVFLMGFYEVQILNSYRNETYPDGQAAAIYGQHPPLVNASRPPMEWQTYDIVFQAPTFKPNGSLESPATITVLHNGVLVQDHRVLEGKTAHTERARYEAHPDKLPLRLQDHGDLVQFRNIWIRPLDE